MAERLEVPVAVELSSVLHALSDPSRRQILAILTSGPRRCGAFDLPLAKSTASHHFKVLRTAGLIRTENQGTSRIAHLQREQMEAAFPGLLRAAGIPDDDDGERDAPGPVK